MDVVLTAVIQSLPQVGIGSGLIVVLVLLLRRESSTEQRHTAELARINTAHDAELSEMRAEMTELRNSVRKLNSDLDTERSRRREIEDELADARRGTRRAGGAR